MKPSDYFPVHAHSEWSTLDGMGTIDDMIEVVSGHGQPALALTDHGNMAGVIRLYKSAKREGIACFPGSELYVVTDATDDVAKTQRYHMGMMALDFEGYKAMVKLSTRSHLRERFHRKPLVDFADFKAMKDAGLTEHVAVTTGCYFGIVVQTLVNKGYEDALKMIKFLNRLFPNLYVEIQSHDVVQDDGTDDVYYAQQLIRAADELGLPIVIGQDSHYAHAYDQPVHDLMKDICYFGDGEDNHFPGGPFHLASTKEMKQSVRKVGKLWDRIEEGHGDLLNKNRLIIPAFDTYKFHVPEIRRNPMKEVWRKSVKGSWARGGDLERYQDKYLVRAKYEFDVIKKMGFGNYFLLVEELVSWCKANHVIVQARGSANGSLICYYMGITEVDPVFWNTDFDRFLSLDRKKPPDIDLDIESGKRGEFLEHVKDKFPSSVNIGTYSKIGITEQDTGDGYFEDKGSLFIQYMAAMRKKNQDTSGTVKPEHRPLLNRMAELEPRRSIGVHAAGIVLPSDSLPIEDYLPLGLVPSSNTTVTQSVMDDVEEAGFVKLDALGLRQLETLSGCMTNLGKQADDFSWIPWDDEATCKLLSSGKTVGIFQFEGVATAKGGREMGIKSTQDAIVCLALYRPALMSGGQKDQYLYNRKAKKAEQLRLHRSFDDILNVTYGVPVFQEQVMQICRKIEMQYDDWNLIVKAVKASNDKIGEYAEETFRIIRPKFITLCMKQGIEKKGAIRVWDTIVGFTDYGFNRAHATGYGITAYRSAYLKHHHPLEYMQSLLNVWTGTPKESMYVQEARRLGIQIARVDVNKSEVGWTLEPGKLPKIRRGLLSLKGIGMAAAECIVDCRPAGGWEDIDEMIGDVPARPVSGGKEWAKSGTLNGVLGKLQDHGALTSLGIEP